jgi:DNA-binding SARP family transcriptional activator/TolB-like protein
MKRGNDAPAGDMNRPVQVGTRLRLHCLGHLRLQDFAGSDLNPRTRKARALLAYLAVTGRPASRERLADLLWSDRGAEQARSSFRQAIFELRHLANEEAALTAPQPDEVSINAELITTDLNVIRRSAEDDDFEQLEALLSGSDAGLLTDLDGLDPEFDAWLRVERAHEPSRTLAIAIEAANRCFEILGPQAATSLVAQIQRLDPSNEEAARLALRIAHQLGDRGSLHRQFEHLRSRLKSEFDAEPSPETAELFRQLSGETQKPAANAANEKLAVATAEQSAPGIPVVAHSTRHWHWTVPVLALAALGGTIAWWPDSKVAQPAEPPLLAVLPFEQLPRGDGSLADGLWEDTRALLSQNGTVRVLGRTTSQAMADEKLAPKAYRERFDVDYVLDGSVQRHGDRIRVTVSLTRTADGIGIWEQAFEGRLGDPLALQGAIAQGIEGRIRGRLARGGGALAEQIATNPEVYALYSEARALLRTREQNDIDAAIELLRRAIARDPGFAPAHASLATALSIGRPSPIGTSSRHLEAVAEARRAIALAPNLSQAHASLALAEGMGSPVAEQALKRAVALDPGNAEAWNWLGNVRGQQFRPDEAIQAYWKGVEADPLWMPAATNLAEFLVKFGEARDVEQIAGRIDRTGGDPELAIYVRSMAKINSGDYSTGLRQLLAYRRNKLHGSGGLANDGLGDGLMRLGYYGEVAKLWNREAWWAPVQRGEAIPPDVVDGVKVGPRDYWLASYFPIYASRAAIKLGHPEVLVDRYRRGFRSSDDFVATLTALGEGQRVLPNLAVALIETGDKAEAGRLLAATDKFVSQGLVRSGNDRELMVELARIRAIQQRDKEALDLISAAIARGWLPDGLEVALDLADEPAFRDLRGNPRFEAARRKIFTHIARERKELGPVKL